MKLVVTLHGGISKSFAGWILEEGLSRKLGIAADKIEVEESRSQQGMLNVACWHNRNLHIQTETNMH